MKLSPAQQKALNAVAAGDVVFSTYGHCYRRRDTRGGVRLDTMAALINKGLVYRPPAKIGEYTPIVVEITEAGQDVLSARA